MKYIEVADRKDRIKITDDKTFQDIVLYPGDGINLEEFLVKLTTELLKEDE